MTAKTLYVNEIKCMLSTMPVEEIRVQDLCKRTKTNRHTFYYYFKDKHELISFVFKETIDEMLRSSRGILSREAGRSLLAQLRNDRQFYKNAFTYREENALGGYMVDYCYDLLCAIMKQKLHTDQLSVDILTSMRYHTFGIVGLLYDWLTLDCPCPEDQLLDSMMAFLPEAMKKPAAC